MGTFKIIESEWRDCLTPEFRYFSARSIENMLTNVDKSIKNISQYIGDVDRISGINYYSKINSINTTIDHLNEIDSYITNSINDIDGLLDDKFYHLLNDENGAVEALELIANKSYTTKNTLGIKHWANRNTYSNTTNAYLSGQAIKTESVFVDKAELNFEDIFKMTPSNIDKFASFSKVLKKTMKLKKKNGKDNKNLKLDEYLKSIIDEGKFDHTVDKGWENWASTALDAFGIVSLGFTKGLGYGYKALSFVGSEMAGSLVGKRNKRIYGLYGGRQSGHNR